MAGDAGLETVVYISMAFGNPYGDLWNVEEVVEAVGLLESESVHAISLADTVGMASPAQIREVVSAALAKYGYLEIGVHLHSRPDQAVEKVLAAYDAGCRRFDSAIGGLGGCPFAQDALVGNIPTEKVLEALAQRGCRRRLRSLDTLLKATAGIAAKYSILRGGLNAHTTAVTRNHLCCHLSAAKDLLSMRRYSYIWPAIAVLYGHTTTSAPSGHRTISRFTASIVHRLVYCESFSTWQRYRGETIKVVREEGCSDSMLTNPTWEDLSEEWFDGNERDLPEAQMRTRDEKQVLRSAQDDNLIIDKLESMRNTRELAPKCRTNPPTRLRRRRRDHHAQPARQA